jgi:hypothetical protein
MHPGTVPIVHDRYIHLRLSDAVDTEKRLVEAVVGRINDQRFVQEAVVLGQPDRLILGRNEVVSPYLGVECANPVADA